MHSMIGIGNLERHWWLLGPLKLTLVLNAIFLSPLLFRQFRAIARFYIPCIAVLIAVIAYFAFEYWMVAVMGC